MALSSGSQSTSSSSSDPRREPGTDLEGMCEENLRGGSARGEAIWDPDRLGRVEVDWMVIGDVRLADEKRFGFEREVGKTFSRNSGGVVGSL